MLRRVIPEFVPFAQNTFHSCIEALKERIKLAMLPLRHVNEFDTDARSLIPAPPFHLSPDNAPKRGVVAQLLNGYGNLISRGKGFVGRQDIATPPGDVGDVGELAFQHDVEEQVVSRFPTQHARRQPGAGMDEFLEIID